MGKPVKAHYVYVHAGMGRVGFYYPLLHLQSCLFGNDHKKFFVRVFICPGNDFLCNKFSFKRFASARYNFQHIFITRARGTPGLLFFVSTGLVS